MDTNGGLQLESREVTLLPPKSGSYESEGSLDFLQQRLRFLVQVILCLGGGFYALKNLSYVLSGEQGWSSWILLPANQVHLASVGALALLWWIYRLPQLSYRTLRWLDLGGMVIPCAIYSFISLTEKESHQHLPVVLAFTNILISRAVLVPSTTLNTLLVGLATSVIPLATGHYLFLRPENASPDVPAHLKTIYVAMWMGVALVVSTVASRVLFGLRREVKEARKLGQYTLLEKIGEGGMGIVYKASHAMLRRPTAIKLVRCELVGEQGIARFEREVQMTSRLTHPNTIAIFDFGRTPDGIFYYAMEYLNGITLDALAKKHGAQPPARVIQILMQVCGSLAEAHSIGLIHRDIKGANVILCRRSGMYDVAKVVDFGLVKDIGTIGGPNLSGHFTITGTPLYLSPEAIRLPESVDARSDIYAVGVLGYLMLTGAELFTGASFVEICGHHLHTSPPAPSARNPQVSPALDAVILKCLEKDRANRYADASALRRALEAASPPPPWTEDDARTWWEEFEGGGASAPIESRPTVEIAR